MLNHNKLTLLAGLITIFVFISTQLSAQETIRPLNELVLPDSHQVSGIDWKPDGSQIAWTVDQEIRIYTSDLQPVIQLQGHIGDVLSIDWSPDGTHLASGGADSTIQIWDMTVNPPTVEKTLTGHTDKVVNVAWSADGSKLASVAINIPPNYDGYPPYTTWIWDVLSEEKLEILPERGYGGYALAWNPNNSNILAQSGIADTFDVVNLASDTEVKEYFIQPGLAVTSFDWDSRGRRLLVGSEEDTLSIADTAVDTLDYQMFLDLPGGAATVDWRGDDTYIAAGTSRGGDIIIWHSATGQQVLNIPQAHVGVAPEPQMNPDPKPEAEIPERIDNIFEIEWSPDGMKLASVSRVDHALRLWDTSNLPDLEGSPTATPPFPTLTPIP